MTAIDQTHSIGRTAGVLLHPTSIPGRYGIGDLGDEMIGFLDWAASAGFRWWQVLPLNPPGYSHSPYGCLSTFAGNPLLISPQRLIHEGLLSPNDVKNPPHFPAPHVDFPGVAKYKFHLFEIAWNNFKSAGNHQLEHDFHSFERKNDQRSWLADYSLFMALKTKHGGSAWWDWEPALVAREQKAIAHAKRELHDEIRFWSFLQFLFFRQWSAIHAEAHARKISILGDVPIYVAGDSADVWANPELFQLDDKGHPTVVAGVPPDYFSKTGQRWGNPLYCWDKMRETNYAWWIERIRANLRMADAVRLDHFRGFAAYWEIPASEETAVNGRWMPGPGMELFNAVREALGKLPLIAEDLGFITQDVHDLRTSLAVPGMKILQFGFGVADSPHLPHRVDANTVVYTGTHDNDTARGFYDHASAAERALAHAYIGSEPTFSWAMIRAAYTSVANTVIVPAQDILDLGADSRMNTPGAEEGNWCWRMLPGALTSEHATQLRFLAEITGRV